MLRSTEADCWAGRQGRGGQLQEVETLGQSLVEDGRVEGSMGEDGAIGEV